ncbi:GGDEF domain-containing protein [Alkalimarinus alittae]|uniref:diguanylate cyclase n=1 Tax=Alkalimarinus alittae TaxID=2961619 RepID=A0ABY6N6V1_9ALTE|nr:GGDEF domain-containing protein [Alkalimarinus alittae]UZE97750.1 GGDEF domain-containing protein [Alkalimarinus alittae]
MTTYKKADTIDFTKARLVSTYNELTQHLKDSDDIISRLTRRLQTTLDIKHIINMFVEEVGKLISFDQFEYNCETVGSYITSEKRAAHSCNYKLKLQNENLGEVSLTRSKKFKEEELAILERLMSTLVYPLKNALMYKHALDAALQDSLTSCGNKRALDIALTREAELSRRHNHPLSIITVDIDHFKNINDQHGHAAGDGILKQLVECMINSARKSDLCFRSGGEEFIVLLNKTTEVGARIIAERLRQSVNKTRFVHGDKIIPLTISLGTATFKNNEDLDSLLERSDKALYEAKNSGRNRVVSAELSGSLNRISDNKDQQSA